MSSIKLVRSETTRSWNFWFCCRHLRWVCFETIAWLAPLKLDHQCECWMLFQMLPSAATFSWFMIQAQLHAGWSPEKWSIPRKIPIRPQKAGNKVKMQWPLRRFWKSIPRQEWKHAETLPASYLFWTSEYGEVCHANFFWICGWKIMLIGDGYLQAADSCQKLKTLTLYLDDQVTKVVFLGIGNAG